MSITKSLIVVAALAGMGSAASAQSLTTTFAGNNIQNGNIFDIETGAQALTLNSVALNINGATADLEFYYRLGTAVGFQGSSAGWTLFSTNTVASSGVGFGSLVNTTDLTFAANTRYGLYFVRTDGDVLGYSDGTAVGNVAATNADLTVYEGYGSRYAFGTSYSPRIVNATFNYTVGAPIAAVPEPATWGMMLVGFGMIGFGMRRRKADVRTSVRFA